MRSFIACANGKDYIIELHDRSREILQIEIATKRRFRHLFGTPREAGEQYRMWIDRSECRLPMCFFVRGDAAPLTMRKELDRLGLPFPAAGVLKKYVKYQRFEDGDDVAMVNLDTIDTLAIPEITIEFLNRMNHHPGRQGKPAAQLIGGML